MKKEEIRNKLKECFLKCAEGRRQLRKCVTNAMNAGLTKQDVLSVADELKKYEDSSEISLCATIAIGQALKHEETHGKIKKIKLAEKERDKIKNKLKGCYKKCSLAKKQLGKCIVNAINAGLTKEEVLAITDDIVGGFGKNEVSACAIVAVDKVLRYEEIKRAKPIDIVKERKFERGDV